MPSGWRLVADEQRVLDRFAHGSGRARQKGKVERLAEYVELRDFNWSKERIAWQIGVGVRTLMRYDAAIRSGMLPQPTNIELAVWEVPKTSGDTRRTKLRRAAVADYRIGVVDGSNLVPVEFCTRWQSDHKPWADASGNRYWTRECHLIESAD